MNNMDKNTCKTLFRTTAIAASIFALSACGGGGSSGSDSPTAPASSLKDQVAPGVYTTELVDDSGKITEGFVSILSPTGKHVVAVNQADMTTGALEFRTDGTFSGVGQRIFVKDGWKIRNLDIKGKVGDDRESLQLVTNDYRAALSRKNELSDQPISLELISGSYTRTTADGDTVFTLNGESLDGFSADTSCVYNGQVAIPDTSINVIEISFLAENCKDVQQTTGEQRNGQFTALATYDNEGNGTLTFVGNNGEVNVLFLGER
ncbi:hypothetical protein [Marinobacter salicampi]|uniref:hypothetical protein n=1 Tax=Marinobacter salicampi TaxID=435907 RepID=UPI00140B6B4B|nr:hypothetical protein [Marinobacter salicampi]